MLVSILMLGFGIEAFSLERGPDVGRCGNVLERLAVSAMKSVRDERSQDPLFKKLNRQLNGLVGFNRWAEFIWALRDLSVPEPAERIEAQLAEVLARAPILEQESIHRGMGASKKYRLVFAKGVSAIAKSRSPDAQREIAAYLLSKVWGFHLVPVTVGRWIDDYFYSVQHYLESTERGGTSSRDRNRELIQLFDFLIGNGDRHGDNLLKTSLTLDHLPRLVGIDHALSLQPIEGGHWTRPPRIPTEILGDREIYQKIRRVSKTQLRHLLRRLIDPQRIEELLIRRDLVLEKMQRFVEDPSVAEPFVVHQGTPSLIEADASVGLEHLGVLEDQNAGIGFYWGSIQNGAKLTLSLKNLENLGSIRFRIACEHQAGTLEVRLDSSAGPLLGKFEIQTTGGWFKWVDRSLSVRIPKNRKSSRLVLNIQGLYPWNQRDLFDIKRIELFPINPDLPPPQLDTPDLLPPVQPSSTDSIAIP